MIAITSTFKTILNSGNYTDGEKVLLLKWLLDPTVELPEGFERTAEILRADQDTLDNSIKESKAKHTERQRRYMERKQNGEPPSPDKTLSMTVNDVKDGVDAPLSPSLPPSLPPQVDNNSRRACAHARTRKPPTEQQVLALAKASARRNPPEEIPEDFARSWYALMANGEPPWTNTKGDSVLGCWTQHFEYAWKRHKKFDTETGSTGKKIIRGRFAPQTSNKIGLD